MRFNLKTKFIMLAMISAAGVLLSHGINTVETVNEKIDEHARSLLILDIASITLAFFVPLFAIRSVFRPQMQVTDAMSRIAKGETDVEIPHTDREDEVGEMARMAQIFRENVQRKLEIAKQHDIMQEMNEQQKQKAMNNMADSFEIRIKRAVDMVASTATEMDTTSRSVANIVDANKAKLGVLANQIEGTTQSMQTAVHATSQLSSAINEINEQITRAASITATTVQDANRADGTVKSLTDAAQKIGEVVEIINSITGQINLLALNATIEAARAGEAGKGFAVVAAEVKNLAAQTSKATEQIGQFIGSIQSATSETVGAIKVISGKIHEINEISSAIAAAVEQQSVSTQQIANNVQQAASGTQEVARSAADVTASSEITGDSANLMISAISELSQQSVTLRDQVDNFLIGIRK